MRKGNSTFLTGFLSETGTFRFNHDYFAFVELDDFACWIAADGINSDEKKKSAEILAHHLFAEFTENPTMSRRILEKYLDNAQQALKIEGGAQKLTASLVMVVTDYARIIWVVAGNSRLYHFRKGSFSFKSKDQSIAELMVEVGKVGVEELDQHEERHNLYNYFGNVKKFKPFVSAAYELNDGDVILLCTAGFWENIKINEMIAALKESETPDNFADNLEEIILKKQNDALNNYTIGAIYADKVFKEQRAFKTVSEGAFSNDILKKVGLAAVCLLVLTGAGFAINQQIHHGKKVVQIGQLKPSPKKISEKPSPEPSPEVSSEVTPESIIDTPIPPIEATVEVPVIPGQENNAHKQEQEDQERKNAKLAAARRKAAAREKAEQAVAAKKNSVQKTDLLSSEKSGDKSFSDGDYERAFTSYRDANSLAKQTSNTTKINLLERKLELTKQILAGDNSFNDRNYSGALEKYQSAIKKADALALSTSYLVSKQNKTEKCIFVLKLITEGDAAYQKGDYSKAKSCYFHANSLANQYGFFYTKQQLKARLSKVGAKAVEANPQKLYSEAQRLESQGDSKSQIKEYKEAVNLYNNAKSIYQQLNKSDEVANIEKKIQKTEKSMNTLIYKITH